ISAPWAPAVSMGSPIRNPVGRPIGGERAPSAIRRSRPTRVLPLPEVSNRFGANRDGVVDAIGGMALRNEEWSRETLRYSQPPAEPLKTQGKTIRHAQVEWFRED